ncbi:MAG: peptidase [Patescibacteria group bacterium]|jgi:subtilisin family serine protease|nr:peptidase [Patescibacteria group bacterium]
MRLKAPLQERLALVAGILLLIGLMGEVFWLWQHFSQSSVPAVSTSQPPVVGSTTTVRRSFPVSEGPPANIVPGRFLVKEPEAFPGNNTDNIYEDLGIEKKGTLSAIKTDVVVNVPSSGMNDDTLEATLRANGYEVEPDQKMNILATPNDPYYSIQWAPPIIEADKTWSTDTGSPTVTIAVIDTGADMAHPDLVANLLSTGYNFIAGTTNPNDDNGHGTHVAGIAAATGNNGVGISGVCWSCKILPIKVMDADGVGTVSAVASGIIYATDHGAHIINLSIGGPIDSQIMADAVQYALDNDVAVVAAAGNTGTSSLTYPAAYPGVISVASSGQGDSLSSYSNYGSWVSTAAPGENIASTYKDKSYAYLSGSSMAAPFVAGEAALLLAHNPSFNNAQLRSSIIASTDPVGSYTESDGGTAHTINGGRINVLQAVNPTPLPTPEPTPAASTAPTATPTPTPIPAPVNTPSDLPELGSTPSPNQPTPAPALIITKPPVNGVASVVPAPKPKPKVTPRPVQPAFTPTPTPAPLAETPPPTPSATSEATPIPQSESEPIPKILIATVSDTVFQRDNVSISGTTYPNTKIEIRIDQQITPIANTMSDLAGAFSVRLPSDLTPGKHVVHASIAPTRESELSNSTTSITIKIAGEDRTVQWVAGAAALNSTALLSLIFKFQQSIKRVTGKYFGRLRRRMKH